MKRFLREKDYDRLIEKYRKKHSLYEALPYFVYDEESGFYLNVDLTWGVICEDRIPPIEGQVFHMVVLPPLIIYSSRSADRSSLPECQNPIPPSAFLKLFGGEGYDPNVEIREKFRIDYRYTYLFSCPRSHLDYLAFARKVPLGDMYSVVIYRNTYFAIYYTNEKKRDFSEDFNADRFEQDDFVRLMGLPLFPLERMFWAVERKGYHVETGEVV